jgi:hypothetical protein
MDMAQGWNISVMVTGYLAGMNPAGKIFELPVAEKVALGATGLTQTQEL